MTIEQPGTLPPGYVLEEYRIERVLGQGGFGITYLAFDTQLRQSVAIKEYFPRELALRLPGNSTVVASSTADEALFGKYLQGFLAEAQTLAQLHHPGIVRVRRYIQQLGTAYMVMDYEDGPSLHEVLAGMLTPPNETFVTDFLVPMLDALAVVHDKEILHRDIKPRNVVLRRNGSPVLLDFGAARSFQAMAAGATAIYSFGYAPPEQVEGTSEQGPWTDIYGMAAVLYHMISLKPPAHSMSRRDLGAPMPSAIQLGKGRYDARLLRGIDWGLRLSPAERPRSIEEWRDGGKGEPGLGSSWHGGAAATVSDAEAATTVAPASATKPPGIETAVGRRYALAGLALVAVVALAIGARTMLGPSREPIPTASPEASPQAPVGVAPTPAAPVAPVADEGRRPVDEGEISALGMVDGTIPRYASNPDLMLADLRADARTQVIEKAVGIFVERGALNEQYDALKQQIFKHAELVEQLSDDAKPRRSSAGLVYLPTKANVRIQDLRRLVFRHSREQRLALIRAQGDPLISVAVSIRDAERGSPIERSALAENVIKERIRNFGFRVATPPGAGGGGSGGRPEPDFAIESEAKLKRLRATLPASGLTIEKYVLTSWTVKCAERSTGEDIYFDNQLPEARSWADEDRALQEIGALIADKFSQDFFAQHLPRRSRYSRLKLLEVKSPEVSRLLGRELLGLRSVVDVGIQEDGGGGTVSFGLSWYDQGPGGEQSFDATVLAPLRRKFGSSCLEVMSDLGAQEVAMRLADDCGRDLVTHSESLPIAALSEAPAERLESIARSLQIMEKLFLINPEGVTALADRGVPDAVDALRRARSSKVDL